MFAAPATADVVAYGWVAGTSDRAHITSSEPKDGTYTPYSVPKTVSLSGTFSTVGYVPMSDALLNSIAGRIDGLTTKVGDLAIAVGKLETKIENVAENMATKTWVLGGVIVTLLVILGAAWWMVQQYLGPILQHLPK